jgi:hypothetical protein
MDADGPWIGLGPIKRCGEAPPGAVQPDPGCVARAADDCRNLTGIEPFPACEGEDVLISGWKATERGREVSRALVVLGRPVRRREVGLEPVGECQPAPLATAVIRQDATGSAIQPEPRLIAGRDLVQPPPGGQERLGQDVGCIVSVICAAQGVPEQLDPVRRVQILEPVSSPCLRGVRRR